MKYQIIMLRLSMIKLLKEHCQYSIQAFCFCLEMTILTVQFTVKLFLISNLLDHSTTCLNPNWYWNQKLHVKDTATLNTDKTLLK